MPDEVAVKVGVVPVEFGVEAADFVGLVALGFDTPLTNQQSLLIFQQGHVGKRAQLAGVTCILDLLIQFVAARI